MVIMTGIWLLWCLKESRVIFTASGVNSSWPFCRLWGEFVTSLMRKKAENIVANMAVYKLDSYWGKKIGRACSSACSMGRVMGKRVSPDLRELAAPFKIFLIKKVAVGSGRLCNLCIYEMADTAEYRVAGAASRGGETLWAMNRAIVEGRAGSGDKPRFRAKGQKPSQTLWYCRVVAGVVAAIRSCVAVRTRERGARESFAALCPAKGPPQALWPPVNEITGLLQCLFCQECVLLRKGCCSSG